MNRLPNDFELVRKLIKSTSEGKISWQSTAEEAQYAASFKGKWSVLVDEYQAAVTGTPYWALRIEDADGREMLKMNDEEYSPIRDLYELARRSALNVDEAITDILKELEDDKKLEDDIPF